MSYFYVKINYVCTMTDEEKKQKKALIIKLLPKKNYHIGKVVTDVGISRRTYNRWRLDDSDFDEACEEVFCYDVDDSEEKLKLLRQGLPKFDDDGRFVGWIERPHFGALTLHLQAKAKDRGYGQSIEVDDKRDKQIRSMGDKELFDEVTKLANQFKDEHWEVDNGEQRESD